MYASNWGLIELSMRWTNFIPSSFYMTIGSQWVMYMLIDLLRKDVIHYYSFIVIWWLVLLRTLYYLKWLHHYASYSVQYTKVWTESGGLEDHLETGPYHYVEAVNWPWLWCASWICKYFFCLRKFRLCIWVNITCMSLCRRRCYLLFLAHYLNESSSYNNT